MNPATPSSTPHTLVPAVERVLSAVWNVDVRLKIEWIARNQPASHIFRVRTQAAGHDLPPTVIVKAAKPEFDLGSQEMVFNEWAALVHLQRIACHPALAARFHAGHVDDVMPFVVMGDLGAAGGSPCDVLDGDDPDLAAQALVEYAQTLGRLHGATVGSADDYRRLRRTLPAVPHRRPLYHDPWSDASAYTTDDIARAVTEYRSVLSELGVPPPPGIDDEIEQVTRSIEEHRGSFLALCQGDQNTLQHCLRSADGCRLVDFGVAGFRHALIEGMPHRLTWGCTQRVPRSVFPLFERAYRTELARYCAEARDETVFRRAMAHAGGRWSVFHVIWRVPDALQADRPRGATTFRQQVLAWLHAFGALSEEVACLPALGTSARLVRDRLRAMWPAETHDTPYYPAFRSTPDVSRALTADG